MTHRPRRGADTQRRVLRIELQAELAGQRRVAGENTYRPLPLNFYKNVAAVLHNDFRREIEQLPADELGDGSRHRRHRANAGHAGSLGHIADDFRCPRFNLNRLERRQKIGAAGNVLLQTAAVLQHQPVGFAVKVTRSANVQVGLLHHNTEAGQVIALYPVAVGTRLINLIKSGLPSPAVDRP